VYLTVFAVLSVAGGWAAWRSNPLYSTRSTMLFVALVGLATAAVLAGIVAAAELTARASTAVALGTTLGAVTVGTWVLIWVTVTVSSPPLPRTPPAVRPVHVHRAKLGRWAGAFVVTLVALGALALVLPGDLKVMPGVLGVLAAMAGSAMLVAGYAAARGMDRALTTVESAPWIRWRYTPEQWRAWTDAETARLIAAPPLWVWRRDWKRLLLPAGGVVLGVWFLDPGGWVWKTAYLLGLFFLTAAAVALSERYARGAPRRLRALLLDAPPESCFGEAGVFADGVFSEWRNAGKYLVDASLDEREPRSIALRFVEVAPGAAPPATIVQAVLIPPGAEADLPRLQTLLSAACPSARVSVAPPAAAGAQEIAR